MIRGNRFKDLTGQVFGRLTAIKVCGQTSNKTLKWLCKCSCGNYTVVPSSRLRIGGVKSCGCLASELSSIRNSKSNSYVVHQDYCVGYDDLGNSFIVDLEDLDHVSSLYWSKNKRGYFHNVKNKIFLHRFIMQPPDNLVVDHISRDVSDNRRINLRVVTQGNNMHNKSTYCSNTSGRTGVYRYGDKYRARITVNESELHLGMFDTFEEAVKARERAENLYFHKGESL